ncbi:MAG TPA: 5-(carboxyamino)imidazole ribonucleotide mutase [Patescibacteria group bacterium]
MQPLVSIILGSDSDLPIMKATTEVLEEFAVPCEILVISAHRNPEGLTNHIKNSQAKVFIGAAGGAAHLPGVIAAQTIKPVIGVPIKTKSLDGMDSLLSIAQMPSGVPVATVAIDGSRNAGLLAIQILATADKELEKKLEAFKTKMRAGVEKKSEELQAIGVQAYLEKLKK